MNDKLASLFHIESERSRLHDLLDSEASPQKKLRVLEHFWQEVVESLPKEQWESFVIEFVEWLPRLTKPELLVGRDPKVLTSLYKILSEFSDFFQTDVLDILTSAETNVQAALFLIWIYLGDTNRAFSQCKKAHGGFDSANPREDVERILAELLKEDASFMHIVSEPLQKWAEAPRTKTNHINALWVIEDVTGIIGLKAPLTLSMQPRSAAYEEDRFLLNGKTTLPAVVHQSFREALSAARHILPAEARHEKDFYSFHFFLDYDSDVDGKSLGLAAALLMATGMMNAFYRIRVAGLWQSIAVTGAIKANGVIQAVQEAGLEEKIQAAFFSPCSHLVVPTENLLFSIQRVNQLKKDYPNRHLAITGVETLGQALQDHNIFQEHKMSTARKILSGARRLSHKPVWAALFLALLFALSVLSFKPLQWWRDRNPVDFEITGRYMYVKNADNQTLWSFDFKHPQKPEIYKNMNRPFKKSVVFHSLENDGLNDVLIGVNDTTSPNVSGVVHCLSASGKPKWQLDFRKEIEFVFPFDEHWRIQGFAIDYFSPNGEQSILVEVSHWPLFPSIIAHISRDGDLLSTFSNSGRFSILAITNLDNDEQNEFIAGGVNNQGDRAFLALLDPMTMNGYFPQNPGTDHYPRDYEVGENLGLFRFPLSPYASDYSGDNIVKLRVTPNSYIAVLANSALYPNNKKHIIHCLIAEYAFDKDWNLKNVSLSDPFLQSMRENFGREITDEEKRSMNRVEKWVDGAWQTVLPLEARNFSSSDSTEN